jgi:hypothetical protein
MYDTHCPAKYKMAASEEFEDYEYVAAPQELMCSICIRVMCRPHLVNCSKQQFCGDCLERWLEENDFYPHCRNTGFSYMFMQQKDRKISELKVYCLNKQHGCKAVLKQTEVDNHPNTNGCQYIELSCPNNCTAKVLCGKMLEHKQKYCPNVPTAKFRHVTVLI